jgi:N-acetylglutamate synthase-like GNAT family acetyltransferase
VADPAADVHIRPARPEDLPQALDLFAELDRFQAGWRVFEPRAGLLEEAEARYRAALDSPESRLLVADEDGRIIGMAHGHLLTISSISDEIVLEVENVVVAPSHRRRGVAHALVLALAGFARQLGIARVALKTYSQRFWESIGFRPRWVQMTATPEELGLPPG